MIVYTFSFAVGRGVEPLQTPPKGVVLPLDDPTSI